LSFVVDEDRMAALQELSARWPGATFVDDERATRPVTQQVFAAWGSEPWVRDGQATAEPPARATPTPLSVLVRGTNFQVRVWEALLRIPAGSVSTYEDIASAVGQSGATRAVGSAVARNPVAYLIPCHRVIRKTGAFGGYHWGPERKIAMLMRESVAQPVQGSAAYQLAAS
jgi:AraC family transcriptional regulator of adaptative response/methylated-DNA-[protein]-cysteine methyltransferase